MITHSVFFKLKHPEDSVKESAFLEKARNLKNISTVRTLRCVREVSSKNNFDFGLIMEFNDQEGYDFYTAHPEHQDFVKQVWLPEVLKFMEIDYTEV
jgi:hypothetical protein